MTHWQAAVTVMSHGHESLSEFGSESDWCGPCSKHSESLAEYQSRVSESGCHCLPTIPESRPGQGQGPAGAAAAETVFVESDELRVRVAQLGVSDTELSCQCKERLPALPLDSVLLVTNVAVTGKIKCH